MANVITRTDLSASLSKAIEPILTKFLAQLSPKQIEIAAEIKKTSEAMAKLPTGEVFSPARRAMSDQISALITERDAAADAKQIKDASWAMNVAAKTAGLHEQPKTSAAKSSGGKRRPRIDKAELEAACQTILAKLPASGKSFVSKPDLAKATKLNPFVAQSALAKLGRAGRVQSNGQRGSAGGWQRKASLKKASKSKAAA